MGHEVVNTIFEFLAFNENLTLWLHSKNLGQYTDYDGVSHVTMEPSFQMD